MDFYDITNSHISELNQNEMDIYDYVLKNAKSIKNMSIRCVSAECYVSTTTFLRFVKKLGFKGYSEFVTVLKFTSFIGDNSSEDSSFVGSTQNLNYENTYLENFTESIRVMDSKKKDIIVDLLRKKPRIYILAKGMAKSISTYTKYIYELSGFVVELPLEKELRMAGLSHIKKSDLVLILNLEGDDEEIIGYMKNLRSAIEKPFILSITLSKSNVIKSLSDINLYVFSEQVEVEKRNITSQIAFMGILELILYEYLRKN